MQNLFLLPLAQIYIRAIRLQLPVYQFKEKSFNDTKEVNLTQEKEATLSILHLKQEERDDVR